MSDLRRDATGAGTGERAGRRTSRAFLPVLLVTLPLLAVPVVLGDSRTYMGVALAMVLTATYAVGFNIVFGLTGQLFLCVGALGAVAGYGTALLADRAGLWLPLALLAGTALSAALGALFSWVAARRSLDVLFAGIVTLTFALALDDLLLGLRDLTGGEDGLRVEATVGSVVADPVGGYLAAVGLLAACLVLFRWLERSHHGWAFRALRSDEVTAGLAGVDVTHHRVVAGALGSAVIGAAGGLHALHEARITPSAYGFTDVDVSTLLVVALGGLGTLLAPVLGALVLGLLDELLLRDLGRLRLVVEGAVLVTLFLRLRGGITGSVANWRRRADSDPPDSGPGPPAG
jgi:branched-chain amino acid transport system permease protein